MENPEFPEIYIGCPVEVSNDPSESDKTYGVVGQVKRNSADIFMFSEDGVGRRHNCLHVSDPRVQNRPDLFTDNDRGVFRLTTGEIRRREVSKRLDAMEGQLSLARGRLEELGDRVEKMVKAPARRGRPAKPQEAEPALTD